MEYATACRVCLAINVPFTVISETPLQLVYETLTDSHLLQANKPSKLCLICHARLQQVYMFTAKAVKANFVLDQMIKTGVMVSQTKFLSAMKNLDRKSFDVVPMMYTDILGIKLDPEYPTQLMEPSDNIAAENNMINMEDPIYCDSQETTNCESDPFETVIFTSVMTIKEESPKEVETQTFEVKETVEETVEETVDQIVEETVKQTVKGTVKQKHKQIRHVKSVKEKVKIRRNNRNYNPNPNAVPIKEIAREIFIPLKQQIKEFKDRALSSNYTKSRYKCNICYTGFTNANTLDNHLLRHNKATGKFECEICHVRYPRASCLRKHKLQTHQRLLRCIKCSHISHTHNQARDHDKWHNGFTYNCTICKLQFSKNTTYLTHKRAYHCDDKYICTWCGVGFVTNNGLRIHKAKSHQGIEPRKILLDPDPNSDRFCKECNAQFATKEALQKHMATALVHNEEQNTCMQCQVCSTALQSARLMALHMRKHERERKPRLVREPKKLFCDNCGKCFPTRAGIAQHITRVHMHAGKVYHKMVVCEVCGLKCQCNAALIVHQRIHTGEQPYKCDRCDKAFRHRLGLKIHVRTHTDERPYACSQCNLRFKQMVGLTRHKWVHTGEKPYSCEMCDKSFSQSNARKVHILTVHHKMQIRRRRRTRGKQNTVLTDNLTQGNDNM